MRKKDIIEAREAMKGTYPEILRKLNALIAIGRGRALFTAVIYIEDNKTLTTSQKQYILNKVEAAQHECRRFLYIGWRFVWQLPVEMRDGVAYMDTFRYIRYLPAGRQQFRLLLKLIKMANHESNPDFIKSSYKKDLYYDAHRVLRNYYIK